MAPPSSTAPSSRTPARPEKIVSGGQTGVDRAALDVALALGIPCGGWVPRGRRAEDGPIPALYPMTETESSAYDVRTSENVKSSDATLVMIRGEPTGGTKFTLDEVARCKKQYHIVDLKRTRSPLAALRWLEAKRPRVLNIAGPRESTAPGIYAEAETFITHLLQLAANKER